MTVRVLSVTYANNHQIAEHAHRWGQLVYAGTGAIHVTAGSQSWIVPPARAVWIPPSTPHALRMRGRTALRTIYLAPDRCAGLPQTCTGLNVVPLLRELVLFALSSGGLDDTVAGQSTMIDALLIMLAAAKRLPFSLTLPRDPRALRAARLMEADPAAKQTLQTLSRESGASLRSLQRLFLAETGMHIAEWRQTAGLLVALTCLLDGGSVTDAGFAAGYESTSAFVAAFRRRTGVTPLAYKRDPHGL